jgi:hypothetical protein
MHGNEYPVYSIYTDNLDIEKVFSVYCFSPCSLFGL